MIRFSEVDSKRFGIPSGRVDDVTIADVDNIEKFCRDHKIKFLIARCAAEDLSVAQKLEEYQCRLMDTLVYYNYNLEKNPPPRNYNKEYLVREMQLGEEDIIHNIARESFRGYTNSHYHCDNKLDKEKCDEIYPDWASTLIKNKSSKDYILVAEKQKIVGFLAMKNISEATIDIVLNGVMPEFQREGVYKALVATGVNLAFEKQKSQVITSTQLNNLAVQKVWVRLGFEPYKAMYTFHKWYI